MKCTITFSWETTSPLSVHTGLAQAGGVDRTVRKRKGLPELPGEAVKAAIREAAERILRWRSKNKELEQPGRSIPTHQALMRLFAPQWAQAGGNGPMALYLFRGSIGNAVVPQNSMEPMEITSTSINLNTGTAASSSLRTVEVWRRGIRFDSQIDGVNGDWSVGKRDRIDLHLLLMAILCADSIGGGWGVGRGELAVRSIACKITQNDPTAPVEDLDINGILNSDAWAADPHIAAWIG